MSKEVSYSDIHKLLLKCSYQQIRYIELQGQFASDVRTFQKSFNVSNKEFAKKWDCSLKHVEKLRKGATEITLKDLAKLRSMYAEQSADTDAGIKTKNEVEKKN